MCLKKYHPEYDIENEKIYSKVYPGKEYNHNNMKKLMSENFIILEKFLLHLKLEKEHFITDKYVLEEYIKRKLNELFLFKVKKINEKLEELSSSAYCSYNNSYGFFYDKYHFEDLVIDFYIAHNITDKKPPVPNFIKRSEYSLCCFLEQLLTDVSAVDIFVRGPRGNRNKEVLISELFSKSLDPKIFLKYLSDNKIKNDFIVLQINLILMIIYPENETYYKQAKHLMLSNNIAMKKNFWIFLTNYCSLKAEKGENKFRFELFEIYKYYIKEILNNTDEKDIKIGSVAYLKIIKIGLRIDELEWTEKFMEDNTKYLEVKEKENAYNYAKALLEFEKQNYEESLSHTSKLKMRTTCYYEMHVNILILKCYFELDLYDSAFSLIDSSKHYLSKTDEIKTNLKEYYSRSLSIIYKLFKLKINCNIAKSDLSSLKSEITNGGVIHKWYLQKVEELEKFIPTKPLSQSKKHLKSA